MNRQSETHGRTLTGLPCVSRGSGGAFSLFHEYIDMDRDAQHHICRGNFLEAAKKYQVMIQYARNDLAAVGSRAVADAAGQGHIQLRVHSQPRNDEGMLPYSKRLLAPFNGLEPRDSFFTFHAVYHRGQAFSEVDTDHLRPNDEESLSVIVALALYNLAMSFMWSEVVSSTVQHETSAEQMQSDQLWRASQMLQLVPTVANPTSLLHDQPFNLSRKFRPLVTNLSLVALNNAAYIHSLVFNVRAAEASLTQMEGLLSRSSLSYAQAPELTRYPGTVTFCEVCLLNILLLHSPRTLGAPTA
jgi:hypothetical protein